MNIPLNKHQIITDLKDGVTELARRHEALQARYLAEYHNNRADRVAHNLAKQVIRHQVATLQHEVINFRVVHNDSNRDHIQVLAKVIKNLRNLL